MLKPDDFKKMLGDGKFSSICVGVRSVEEFNEFVALLTSSWNTVVSSMQVLAIENAMFPSLFEIQFSTEKLHLVHMSSVDMLNFPDSRARGVKYALSKLDECKEKDLYYTVPKIMKLFHDSRGAIGGAKLGII